MKERERTVNRCLHGVSGERSSSASVCERERERERERRGGVCLSVSVVEFERELNGRGSEGAAGSDPAVA